jgi:hypothetical protein
MGFDPDADRFFATETDPDIRRTSDLIQEVGLSKLREDFKEQHGFEGDNKEVYAFAMDRVLQRNALSALTTGFMLRSWLGVQKR